jgi:hypothetical protein
MSAREERDDRRPNPELSGLSDAERERKKKREVRSRWMSDVSVAWHRIGEHWRVVTQALQKL